MDPRREIDLISKHYRRHDRGVGETVWWFEFIPFGDDAVTESVFDPVYDDSPSGYFPQDDPDGTAGRKYRKPIKFPVLWIEENEDDSRPIEQGRIPVQTVQLAASLDEVRKHGMSMPYEYKPHLNDIFFYDRRYYTVNRFRVRGRAQNDLILLVTGLEIYEEHDRSMDAELVTPGGYDLPWPSQFPQLISVGAPLAITVAPTGTGVTLVFPTGPAGPVGPPGPQSTVPGPVGPPGTTHDLYLWSTLA
jgi:hypothetical protein